MMSSTAEARQIETDRVLSSLDSAEPIFLETFQGPDAEEVRKNIINDNFGDLILPDVSCSQLEDPSSDENRTPIKSTPRSFSKFVNRAILTVLEFNNRIACGYDNYLKVLKDGIDATVPAVSNSLGSYILPDRANQMLTSCVRAVTRVGTTLGTGVGKAALHFPTFGAMRWLQVLRTRRAAGSVLNEISEDDNFLVRDFVKSRAKAPVREGLTDYQALRKELEQLREAGDPGRHANRINDVATKLAYYEVNYRNNSDFKLLKEMLDESAEFIETHQALIRDLSRTTAARLISKADYFYQDNLGHTAKPVSEGLVRLATEEGRAELEEKIAVRLERVYLGEVDKKEVKKEARKLYKDLFSAFGGYKGIYRASLYTLLALVPIPAEPVAEADSLLGEVGLGLKRGMDAAFEAEGATASIDGFIERVGDFLDYDTGLDFFPSSEGYLDYARVLCQKCVGEVSEFCSYWFGEAVEAVGSWIKA